MTGEVDSSMSPDQLRRPPGNDLKTNYGKHDIGQAWIVEILTERYGLTVEEWGIDRRDDDGDRLIYEHDAVDLAVYDGDELICLFEIKTKSSPEWMGQFNRRHYQNYMILSEEYGVPVVLCMCLVNYQEEEVEDYFMGPVDENMTLETKKHFPDGNRRVTIKWSHMRDWAWFEGRILQGVDE